MVAVLKDDYEITDNRSFPAIFLRKLSRAAAENSLDAARSRVNRLALRRIKSAARKV
jgi:hypothetical protein